MLLISFGNSKLFLKLLNFHKWARGERGDPPWGSNINLHYQFLTTTPARFDLHPSRWPPKCMLFDKNVKKLKNFAQNMYFSLKNRKSRSKIAIFHITPFGSPSPVNPRGSDPRGSDRADIYKIGYNWFRNWKTYSTTKKISDRY